MSVILSKKGWARSNHDTLLLTAPCKECKRIVQVFRSGVYEGGNRHSCAAVRAA